VRPAPAWAILTAVRFAYHVMSSPLGLLFLAHSGRGLRYLEYMDRRSLKRTIGIHEPAEPDATWEPSLLELKPYVEQLDAFFSGTLRKFSLRLDPEGTPFQHGVWRALLDIPFAETRSYGEIARTIGQPRSARAVGLANNQNPIAIIVPCHRVIGAGGSLVGYGGGVHRKKWLLQHELRFAKLDQRAAMSRAPGPLSPRPAVAAHVTAARPATPARVAARRAARPESRAVRRSPRIA